MADLRDLLQGIYDREGRLTPTLVVDEAVADDHPLHAQFDWDDEIAGPKWRLHQAHELIRSARVVYKRRDGTDSTIRAFHTVRGETGYQYEPLDEIVADEFLSELVRREMRREWLALRARYDRFEEFRELVLGDMSGGD